MDASHREEAAERLSRRTVLGVFTLTMAAEAGFTRSSIRHRRATGRWRHVIGGAYIDSTGAHDPDLELRRRGVGAALTWPDGVVCLRTAAILHGMPVRDDGFVHMVAPSGRRPRAGLIPHTRELAAEDVRRLLTFRVTSPRLTALDCLASFPRAESESLLAWVRTREIVSVEDLDRAVLARARRRGVRQLDALAESTRRGALSEGERRLHRILDDAGIADWAADRQVRVGGRIIARADVLFPAERLILEVDGRHAHADFERERVRLNALTLGGYTVLRFTWRQLVDRPWWVREQVEAALRQAGHGRIA